MHIACVCVCVVCMYVYVCLCMCVYIYRYTHTHAKTHTHTHTTTLLPFALARAPRREVRQRVRDVGPELRVDEPCGHEDALHICIYVATP